MFLVFCWLALSCCCSNQIVYTPASAAAKTIVSPFVIIDDDFSIDQKIAIIEGINAWMFALHGGLKWTLLPDSHRSIREHTGTVSFGRCQELIHIKSISSQSNIVKKNDEQNRKSNENNNVGNTLGMTFYRKCSYTVVYIVTNRMTSKDEFIWTATHEFAHAIGLGHVEDPKAMMNALYSSKTLGCITDSDANLFCQKFQCNPKSIRTCSQ